MDKEALVSCALEGYKRPELVRKIEGICANHEESWRPALKESTADNSYGSLLADLREAALVVFDAPAMGVPKSVATNT